MSEEKKSGLSRRDFLKVIGVAGGTAAVTGACSGEPVEQIIPYVIPPESYIPAIPKFYASTCRECPAGCGIIVKNRDGRAIKIEGNPLTQINQGGSCARGQASLQGLYNPDRIRSPLGIKEGRKQIVPIGWEEGTDTLAEKINELVKSGKGNRIVYLSNNISGTLNDLVDSWIKAVGGRHYTYESFSYDPIKEANRICFGIDEIPTYNIQNADYVLSFGADFLETWLSPTYFAKGFSKLKTYKNGKIGKLVQVEPRASITAASADSWIAVKPGTEVYLALGIANSIISNNLNKNDASAVRGMVSKYTPEKVSELTDIPAETINQIATEFCNSKSIAIGGGVAVSGSNATETMVAVNVLNYLSGNIGRTIDFSNSLSISNANSFKDIARLFDDMNSGKVELLIVQGVNPAFTMPKSLNAVQALKNVEYIVSLSSFMDETTEMASLVLPDDHSIESWGDFQPSRAYVGIIQPAMRPVFNTKSAGNLILEASKKVDATKDQFAETNYFDYLKNSWKKVADYVAPAKNFELFWNDALENGGVELKLPPRNVSLSSNIQSVRISEPEIQGDGEFYFVTYPSYRYYDGSGANKPWLQELPEALSTSVWDSFVEIHPDTAEKLGIREGSFLNIKSPQGELKTQAFVYEGIRPDTIAIPMGQGHKSYGRYAKDRGVNPLDLLPDVRDKISGGLAFLSTKVSASSVGSHSLLVRTQYTRTQHDRDIARSITVDELKHGDHQEHHEEPDFYPEREYPNHRWAMNIDLTKCTGCGACITACYAENNIPFVGKDQVAKRRDMSWIRIERYFDKDDNGKLDTKFLPMLCQQCGNAPCEPVCPVYATYHNHEGLNGMIYNRCVGTRYCANNCTYKVRKFNWYTYKFPEPLNWQLNPDVTVRTKGVMEKCTFCVQRIKYGQDIAKDGDGIVRDGDILTACQQACPTNAIVFGDLKDSASEVSKLSKDTRGYKVLEFVNTKPGITYLKKVKWDNA
ncbi:MAG: molybdopterin-dependent oxidoreductase [Thermodesulfobacteriota bacterium]